MIESSFQLRMWMMLHSVNPMHVRRIVAFWFAVADMRGESLEEIAIRFQIDK